MLNVDNQSGIRNPDGTFYRVGQPLSNIQCQNQADRARCRSSVSGWIRASKPYTRQTAIGWSHQMWTTTVLSS